MHASSLDLVTEKSMEIALYALPTFLVLLHSTTAYHQTHRSLELYHAETAKFVLQVEAQLQATSVEHFPENYYIVEQSACHVLCRGPRHCFRTTPTE
jgi:hypothetical protein